MNFISRRAILAVLLIAFSPMAKSSDVYNIHEFKVHGVSLGDSAEQVIEALIKYYSINRDELVIEDDIGYGDRERAIGYIDYLTDERSVRTSYNAYIDPETKKEADGPRSLDRFSVNWKPSHKSYEDYAKNALEQFGQPTFASTLSSAPWYRWCEKIDAEKTGCDKAHASLSLDKRSVYLRLNAL